MFVNEKNCRGKVKTTTAEQQTKSNRYNYDYLSFLS